MSPEMMSKAEGTIRVTKDDELPEGLKKDIKEEQCDDEDVDVDVESDGIVKTKPSLLPSPCNSEEDEPQMTTPEDPVIHSPPSLRAPAINSPSSIAAALSHNSPLNGYGSPNGCDESRTSCESPGSACDSNGDLDARRRQKTCRVCGDHATGYNFNVITCESCKAFFRRNALRPKEFKCPYSEDCDINAVSRRFCQKCRLRKCFSVGMKKEWILNEEQLRRRKNSRLNNMQSQQRLRHQHDVTNKIMQQAQLHSPPGRGLVPMMSPPGSQFPLLSPTDSNNSDSPPRPIASLLQGQHSPDYEPSMLMQQRLAAARAAATAAAAAVSPLPTSFSAPAPLRPSTTQRISVDPVKNTVMLSMDEYNSLVQMASNGVSPLGASGIDGSPEYKPNVFSPMNSLASPIANGISSSSSSSYANLDALNVAKAEGIVKDDNDRFKLFLDPMQDNAITEEMRANESPDYNVSIKRNNMSNGDRINYQLNTAELRALDIVREAFSGMNEPLDAGRQRESFMKADKTPTDIMNIMDITMRRLVKMAKKLPAFNELSNEGKFAMLKGGMVEMLTVRGVARFDSTSNSWKTPVVPNQYGVSVNMFDQLNMNNRDIQKTRFVSFVRSLHEDLRKNELAVNLLMLIVLFTRRENVQCTEDDAKMIEKHHREYVSLLNRYLESLYGEDARKLQEILPRAIDLLHVIGKNSITLFMGTVKPEEAEPLPREFFKTSDD